MLEDIREGLGLEVEIKDVKKNHWRLRKWDIWEELEQNSQMSKNTHKKIYVHVFKIQVPKPILLNVTSLAI
jgi:hypothetical protein